ncbi:hypothetical protein VTH06DRAFT_5415 [Thermothelomyces fergusii]
MLHGINHVLDSCQPKTPSRRPNRAPDIYGKPPAQPQFDRPAHYISARKKKLSAHPPDSTGFTLQAPLAF